MTTSDMRAEILKRVARYQEAAFPERSFIPGETPGGLRGPHLRCR